MLSLDTLLNNLCNCIVQNAAVVQISEKSPMGQKKKPNKMSDTKPWLYAWNNNPLLIKHLNLLLSVPLFKRFLILWYTEHILFINAMSYLKIRYQEKKIIEWVANLPEKELSERTNFLRESVQCFLYIHMTVPSTCLYIYFFIYNGQANRLWNDLKLYLIHIFKFQTLGRESWYLNLIKNLNASNIK